jgi:hypothetical protein
MHANLRTPPVVTKVSLVSDSDVCFQFKVLEQITPSQFYVHIQDNSQLGELPKLHVEMNEHYNKMPPKKGFK